MLAELLDRVPLMPFDPLPRIPSAALPPRLYRLGPLAAVLLVLCLALASIAHAQPGNWTSYEQGDTRYYQGTDAQGRQWSGRSYLLWGMRFYEFTGPDGETQRCRAYEQPGARQTECFP
jgi:hypothetical protein